MSELFIVAEVSSNHLGSLDRALQIIEAASEAGADAVKFQAYTPETMVPNNNYTLTDGPWAGRRLIDIYREGQTPMKWFPILFDKAYEEGLIPFATPFTEYWVDYLEALDCPIYKVASYELVDTPLIRRIAQTGKRIIMSTGAATEDEIETALKEAKSEGPRDITLLHCVSEYPSKPEDAKLDTMSAMYFKHKCHVGLSDHSLGIGVAVAAAGKGASVIEKHLTLNRADGGLDSGFSMEPHEFKQMVTECRRAYLSRGIQEPIKPSPLRRSLYFSQDLPKGTKIKKDHLTTARPALGISPQAIDNILEKTIIKPVRRADPVTWEVLSVSDCNNE